MNDDVLMGNLEEVINISEGKSSRVNWDKTYTRMVLRADELKRKAEVMAVGQKGRSADKAMNGGIDLNQINVKRNGKTVNVQFDPVQLNELMQGGVEGFTPVIINITHISSPFQLLGINPPKQEVLAKV